MHVTIAGAHGKIARLLIPLLVARGDRVSEIDRPTLVYVGADDIDDFTDAAAWLADRMPDVTHTSLEGLGGFPAWEAPDRVNRLVADFLARS